MNHRKNNNDILIFDTHDSILTTKNTNTYLNTYLTMYIDKKNDEYM